MGKNGTSQIAKPGSNSGLKLEKAAEKALKSSIFQASAHRIQCSGACRTFPEKAA
jgi:hypothetical protein